MEVTNNDAETGGTDPCMVPETPQPAAAKASKGNLQVDESMEAQPLTENRAPARESGIRHDDEFAQTAT